MPYFDCRSFVPRAGNAAGCEPQAKAKAKAKAKAQAKAKAKTPQAASLEEEQAYQRWKARRVVSPRLAKRRVFAGKMAKTKGRLTKDDLRNNRRGKVVSIQASEHAMLNPWMISCSMARDTLCIKGFRPCKKGTNYYTVARKYHGTILDGLASAYND